MDFQNINYPNIHRRFNKNIIIFCDYKKYGTINAPFQNIILDDLVRILIEIFSKVDVIYLDQDCPGESLIIESPSDEFITQISSSQN